MGTKLIGIAGSLGLLAVLGGPVTPAADSWTRIGRTEIVRILDERDRNPYQEFRGAACPHDGSHSCQLAFPPVPAGFRLVVEHVNATVSFAAGGVRRTALLAPGDFVFAFPARPISDPSVFIVNEPTLTYYEAGESPVFHVVLQDEDDVLVTAAISGHLVRLDP